MRPVAGNSNTEPVAVLGHGLDRWVTDLKGATHPGMVTLHERGRTHAGVIEGGAVVAVAVVPAGGAPAPPASSRPPPPRRAGGRGASGRCGRERHSADRC